MFGVRAEAVSNSALSLVILLPLAFFSPLLPPVHYFTHPLHVPSPLTFFSTLFISLPSNPSLHIRSLSIHLVEQCC